MINFNINNRKNNKTLDLNNKKLKIRQDKGDIIKSPVKGQILEFDDDTCGGRVIILFEYKNKEYTLVMCEVVRKNYGLSTNKISVGEDVGVSTGSPLYITVNDHRNEPVKLSAFSDEYEKTEYRYDRGSKKDTFFDYMIDSLYSSLGDDKSKKVNENIERIKKLL